MSDNETQPISRVMIFRHLIFFQVKASFASTVQTVVSSDQVKYILELFIIRYEEAATRGVL